MQEFATRKAIVPRLDLRQPNCLFRKYRMAVRIMKLTAILLTVACIQLSAKGITQTVTISVKDAPLFTVLKAIQKQTDFTFIISNRQLQKAKPVSISATNMPLQQVLEICFKDQPLTYKIIDKVISVIIKVDKENKKSFTPPLPKNIDISGKVTVENGGPLAGANVVEKGKRNGTTTSEDGVFVLKGVDENGSLEISYVGYETLTIPINNRTTIVVSIKQSDANLTEVVINKGYYTEAKRFSTGNVATVTAKDIEKQPVQNPLLALQGRVPGLEITQTTGINGGGVKVRIQGINSLGSLNGTVGTEPLIVVDGVPFPSKFSPNIADITQGGSPLNYINISDIESISVLKDADATAIYGSRAANGAILITTKKGKVGKPKLSIDLQQGWGKVTRHVDMLNTRQYLDMRYEALKNDGLSPNPNSDYDITLWDTISYTDWQKELIGGTAQYTNLNAGVSGGSASVRYMVGANYNRQTTVFPDNYENKAGGLHFSLDGNSPNQRLHIHLSGSYTYNENSLPFFDLTESAVLLEPNAPKLYNEDGSLNWAPNASGSSTWNNPLARATYSEYGNATKNLLTNINISYSLLPGLVLSSNFGYNDFRSDIFTGIKLKYYAPENRATSQRSASFATRNISSWIIEPQLQFEKNIGKTKLDALIGMTTQKSSSKYLQVLASGQSTDELLHSIAAATSVRSAVTGNSLDYTTRFNGLFGRIGYNWDKKYLINLTGRRDGSSKFGDENRFQNFWSAGAGWIFSEESWFHSVFPIVSFGKLRASFGITGNDQIDDYSYLSLYDIVTSDILYQGTTGFNVAGLSNPFLQWEETRKMQGGIDLSAFNERIALSLTYAHNRSSNQLINYSLPDLTGFSSFTKNLPATIQNTSLEFSLNTINIKSKNFTWATNFNLTIPRNKVRSFPGIELSSYASGFNGVIVGEPIGVQRKIPYGGVDPATGYYYPLDRNGKPIYYPNFANDSDYTANVSLLPKYYGGISNTISYKGFQLDFLFQFVYQMGAKNMYYSNPNVSSPGAFTRGNSNQPVSVLNRWQKPGDNASIGRYNSNYSLIMWPPQTDDGYSYAAGSYIRLKTLSLSWQLPEVWTKKAHLQAARIYFRGQNLVTITDYKGLDPETRSVSTLPPLQMWTVGAKVEL